MGNGSTQMHSETNGQEGKPEPNLIRQQNYCPRFEYNDGVKIEIPAHLQKPLTLKEEMQRFITGTVSQMMEDRDAGSFEDEDDFEDDEPDNLMSGYEVLEMAPLDGPEILGDDPKPREPEDPPPSETPAEPPPAEPEARE